METAPLVQGKYYGTNHLRRDEAVLLKRLRQLLKRRPRQQRACTSETCISKADEKLHEQATRLHVLEWEAYGHPKQRPRKP